MGLLTQLRNLGKDKDSDSDDGRPPKPDDKQGQKTIERTRYEATVEYRNGDTETFECYGIYSRGDNVVTFNTNPYGRRELHNWEPSYSYEQRQINYETLSREPTLEKVGTDIFVLTYDVTHKWCSGPGYTLYHAGSKSWHEKADNIELAVAKDGIAAKE